MIKSHDAAKTWCQAVSLQRKRQAIRLCEIARDYERINRNMQQQTLQSSGITVKCLNKQWKRRMKNIVKQQSQRKIANNQAQCDF